MRVDLPTMSSPPTTDEDVQLLENRVKSLEKETLALSNKLVQAEVKLLQQECCDDKVSDSDDMSLSDEYDSDLGEEYEAIHNEMEIENLRHLFQAVRRDFKEEKSVYEDQIDENNALINDLQNQIKQLRILEEKENAIQEENQTLKSTIKRLVEQHEQEVLSLKQQITDAKHSAKQIRSLEQSIKMLSKDRDALKAEVYKLQSDDAGRKLSGSSESVELIQLRKENEKLVREIDDLQEALDGGKLDSIREMVLDQCCQIMNDCMEGDWVNLVCPRCNDAIPGSSCDLCAAFQRITRLKEERDKLEKELRAGEIQDGKVPIFMLVVVAVVILIIIACWFLSFLSCSKNNLGVLIF